MKHLTLLILLALMLSGCNSTGTHKSSGYGYNSSGYQNNWRKNYHRYQKVYNADGDVIGKIER